MFSPPREDGREAFSHDQSGNGPPARSERASRITLSKDPWKTTEFREPINTRLAFDLY